MTTAPSANELFQRALPFLSRSIEQRQAGRTEDALASLDALLAAVPEFFPCLPERAALLVGLERYEEALADLNRFLAVAGPAPEVLQARDAIAAQALDRFDEAGRRDPADPALRRARVLVLADREREAEAAFADILARHPDQREALMERGRLLLSLGRAEESLACYEKLEILEPDDAVHPFNRGNVLKALLRLEEAKAAYARALDLAPGAAEAQLETAFCHLLAGDYGAGWPLFEARWQTAQLAPRHLPSAAPRWDGAVPAPGATLLLWAEQGLGDSLQFLRFVPDVVARHGGRVLLRLPRTLLPLAAGLGAEPMAEDEALPPHDAHCPLMSLPFVLGLGAPAPLDVPYLRSDPALRARWRDRLAENFGARRRPRVGLVWAGRQHGQVNPTRDMPLAALAPLGRLGMDLVSLQQDVPAADQAALAFFPGLWRPHLDTMAGTAALMDELDMIVGVDTALVHLAGALGRPCRVLLRHSSEWRWQLDRDDTPWYPTLQLFRQRRPGDWDGVAAELARAWWPG